MKKKLKIILIVALLAVCALPGYRECRCLIADLTPTMTMVIDAGHGGQDSGAVARDGTQEKDINLSISKVLAKEAARYKVKVIMTRENDDGLYDDSTDGGSGKWTKLGDMKARRTIMDNAGALLVVSIHLNSFYSDESVHGTQVFYPVNCDEETAKKNEALATTVKETLKTEMGSAGDRIILPKKDMYIFRDAPYQGMLIECGFLSNSGDLANLKEPTYQKAFAKALMKGIAANYSLSPSSRR